MAENANQNDNLMGALAYLLGPVTGIILLLVEKKSQYIRYHAMQSVVVFGAIFLVSLALNFLPILGTLMSMLLSLVSFILWIYLMYHAYSGVKYKVPYLGDVAEQQLAKFK